GPGSALTSGIAVAAAAGGFGASLLWLFRWPTRVQSLMFNFLCCVSIAAGCLALSSPYAGLMGCAMFAVIGGFLAYFHSLAQVVANFLVAIGCIAVTAIRLLTETGDGALTAAAVISVLALNAGVPFGVQSLLHSLHADLRNADR
ncbi:GGDEF domain-containing protein, partial [Mycobacterium sp. ITM-2017-0098]